MTYNYSNVQEAVETLAEYSRTMHAYGHAMNAIYLDADTAAPRNTAAGRRMTMEVLSGITFELSTDPRRGELIAYLEAHADELDAVTRRQVEVARKSFDQMSRIPAEEYVAYCGLLTEAQSEWTQAKNDSDFCRFAPYLKQIVDYNRKFARYYNPDMLPYDALLNEFEEGLTMETLDGFFARLRSAIVPLLAATQAKEQINDSFLEQAFPIEIQRKYADYLMDVLGLDRGHCGICETEHPYTLTFNNQDVRISTHYHEKNLTFAMYSTIHEGGHALYELGCGDEYEFTNLSGGASMSIHESQSRFYENIIGRSRPFVHLVFPRLKELFPRQLKDVDAEMFYRAVNKAQPSLIRTEADELTYCIHVMIRYEIEKMLIGGTLAVADVPAQWNRMYKEYLGIDVPNDREGCLQDSHWSGGMIGYFPSYALGSAYGAQILANMQKDLGDIYEDVAKGDLSRITGWLGEKIHRHAGFKKPAPLFEDVCGKFDAGFYTDYLTKKFTELYGL